MCDQKRGPNSTLSENAGTAAPRGTRFGKQGLEIRRAFQSRSGSGDAPRGEPRQHDWTSQGVLATVGLHRRHRGDTPAETSAGSTRSLHAKSLNAFAALEAAAKKSRRGFVAKLAEYRGELDFAGDPATGGDQLEAFLDRAMFISHRIAGAAKTLGFPELGDRARQCEAAIAASKEAPGSFGQWKVPLARIHDLAGLIDVICAEHGAEERLT